MVIELFNGGTVLKKVGEDIQIDLLIPRSIVLHNKRLYYTSLILYYLRTTEFTNTCHCDKEPQAERIFNGDTDFFLLNLVLTLDFYRIVTHANLDCRIILRRMNDILAARTLNENKRIVSARVHSSFRV